MAEHQHEGCGCGHDHDHDHEEEVFVVTDEEGVDREMIMVYSFECGDKGYAVLLDRNDPESDGVIFRLDEEGDETYLVNIEDEQEWQQVVEAYNKLLDEEA